MILCSFNIWNVKWFYLSQSCHPWLPSEPVWQRWFPIFEGTKETCRYWPEVTFWHRSSLSKIGILCCKFSPHSSQIRNNINANPMPGGVTGIPCSLGEINTGTWPSRLGESQNINNKMCSWVLWDSDLRRAELVMSSKKRKRKMKTTDPTSRQRGRPTSLNP
jgi:hypothetical protein